MSSSRRAKLLAFQQYHKIIVMDESKNFDLSMNPREPPIFPLPFFIFCETARSLLQPLNTTTIQKTTTLAKRISMISSSSMIFMFHWGILPSSFSSIYWIKCCHSRWVNNSYRNSSNQRRQSTNSSSVWSEAHDEIKQVRISSSSRFSLCILFLFLFPPPTQDCLSKDTLIGIRIQNIIQQYLKVLGRDILQIADGAIPAILTMNGKSLEGANGRIHPGPIHGITYRSRIGEVGELHPLLNVPFEGGVGIGINVVLQVATHDRRDLDQFVGGIVGEINVVANAGHHPGYVGEEFVHAVLVSRHGHDEIVLIVLHDIEENFDRLLPVIAIVGGVVKVVGLVDEEDAAHGLLDHLLRFGGGVSHVLAHEIVPRGQDDMTPASVSHLGQDLAHAHGHGGLAGAGSAGEAHVQGGDAGFESELATHLVQHQQGGDLFHALLHGQQAHEVLIQLVQLILDALLEHEFVDRPRRPVVGHVAHVLDLGPSFLAANFCGAFPSIGLLEDLATLDVGLVELLG